MAEETVGCARVTGIVKGDNPASPGASPSPDMHQEKEPKYDCACWTKSA